MFPSPFGVISSSMGIRMYEEITGSMGFRPLSGLSLVQYDLRGVRPKSRPVSVPFRGYLQFNYSAITDAILHRSFRPLSGLSLVQFMTYTRLSTLPLRRFRPLSGLSLVQYLSRNLHEALKIVSVPFRGYLQFNRDAEVLGVYEKVSVPFRGYLQFNKKYGCVITETKLFPSPFGVISSSIISGGS